MTRGHVLLPEESGICGCKQDNGGVLLTSDGWLAEEVPARFEGLTRLHRLLHLSKIASPPSLEVRKHNGIARLAIMVSLVFASGFLWFMIVDNTELILEGEHDIHICEDGQEIPYELWMDGQSCADGSGEEAGSSALLMFSPMILGWTFLVLRIKEYDEKILSIVHENGTMGLEEISNSLNLLWKFYMGTLVLWIFLFGVNGLKHFLFEYHIHIIVALIGIIVYSQIQQHREKNESPEEIPYVPLEEFHERLLTALGLSEGDSDSQEIRSLEDIIGGELVIIRKRLEEHEAILTQIIVHYDQIYSGSAPWMGATAVRTSTEILLEHRLKDILPNPSKGVRTLANLSDQLKRHDRGVNRKVLGSIGVIRTIVGDTTHNLEATKEEYLTVLQRFAEVVEWHLSTPPKSIIDI